MKLLIIGGMHGNEPLGIELIKSLRRRPLPNVQTILANEKAVAADRRFVKIDLNRSFPGELDSPDYEKRRPAELLKVTQQYDLVLDFHNTHCPDNDCGFVGPNAYARLYDAAAWLGLRRIIVADYDCVNKYAPNCLSVEISLSSRRMNMNDWRRRIAQLARRKYLPSAEYIEKYRFVYRITPDDRERLRLAESNLKAFKPLDAKAASALGVASPAYPIFIDDRYTPYNYGGLLNKLP